MKKQKSFENKRSAKKHFKTKFDLIAYYNMLLSFALYLKSENYSEKNITVFLLKIHQNILEEETNLSDKVKKLEKLINLYHCPIISIDEKTLETTSADIDFTAHCKNVLAELMNNKVDKIEPHIIIQQTIQKLTVEPKNNVKAVEKQKTLN